MRTRRRVNKRVDRWALVAPVLIACGLFFAPASGHDAKGIAVQELNSVQPEIAAALAATPIADVATRSVLNNLQLWPIPRRLTVCFLSGSPAVRRRVTASMQKTWPLETLTGGRLSFDCQSMTTVPDCGATPSADIRIDFKPGDGYWSYVGIESRNHVPSMNLQGFTETTPDTPELDRLVGHETGHALGLEHEHQSPASPECGWNFTYIWTHYVWKSDTEMHYNFDKVTDYIQQNKHAYIFSSYDQKSLMHYSFEPEAFLDGNKSKCYIPQNQTPSSQDLNAIQVAYGPQFLADQQQTRSVAPTLAQKFSTPGYARLRELVQLKIALMP